MKLTILVVFAILVLASAAGAGCIGPVILGECTGQPVPWDTHPDSARIGRQSLPPGAYWDRRSDSEHRRHSDPHTGRDPHDPRWLDPVPMSE